MPRLSPNGHKKDVVMNKPKSTDLTVGLDVGFGVIKAVIEALRITFPSVYGHAREINFRSGDLSKRYPGMQLTDDEGDWFIGHLAYSQFQPQELLRLHGRTGSNDVRLRLAKAGIGALLLGTSAPKALRSDEVLYVRVATGLPVSHMSEAPALKETLLGPHRIQTDQIDVTIDITDVMVMPQPYGTIYSQTLTSDGQVSSEHKYPRLGVCDVGTYTVDVSQEVKGDYVQSGSGSAESGVHLALERIADVLERKYQDKIPYDLVDETLQTGYFTAFGEKVDYRAEVRDALEPVRSATINLLRDRWRKAVTMDAIYLSGGGGPLVYEVVRREYPQTRLVENPQLANATGYFNYARLVEVSEGLANG